MSYLNLVEQRLRHIAFDADLKGLESIKIRTKYTVKVLVSVEKKVCVADLTCTIKSEDNDQFKLEITYTGDFQIDERLKDVDRQESDPELKREVLDLLFPYVQMEVLALTSKTGWSPLDLEKNTELME